MVLIELSLGVWYPILQAVPGCPGTVVPGHRDLTLHST